MRRLVSATAVALIAAVGAPIGGATRTDASPLAVQSCLAASGAKLGTMTETSRYPEEKQVLFWAVTPQHPIAIYFTANDSAAARLEQRFTGLGLSFGYTNAQIAPTQGRIANVVWATDVGFVPSAQQLGLLKSCLATASAQPAAGAHPARVPGKR